MVMEPPALRSLPSLPANGKQLMGSVSFLRPRTMTVTTRVTYDAAATSGIRVNLYFSPDGKLFDTIAYTYYDVNFTAGKTVQETKIIDAPEEGYMNFEVENLDTSYAAMDIKLWVRIQEWGEG